MNKDFMSLKDASKEELIEILDLADCYKNNRSNNPQYLIGQSIGLIFLKNSTRTRISFEVGVQELGGRALYLDSTSLQIGRGESYADTAKVLSGYLNGIVIRGDKHNEIVEFAKECKIPVINALTDLFHPCQLLADLQLIKTFRKNLNDFKITFLGDCASNMAYSWVLASSIFGFELSFAGPKKYWGDSKLVAEVKNKNISFSEDVQEAVKDADFIYTDVWVSMGFENEKKQRMKDLIPYQVNKQLLSYAKPNVQVMHCLPAYRGLEISKEIIDSPNTIIWQQAENRLHAQKALMTKLFKFRH